MDGRRREPRVTSVSRLAHGWRLDRNPLRRASDRAETVLLILLVVAFVVTAPLAALEAGARVHALAQRTAVAQQSSRHQVTATVVGAPALPPPESGDIAGGTAVRWTAPNGKAMTGQVSLPLGTQLGAKVRVWTTRSGQLAGEPMSESQVAELTALGEAGGAVAVAVVLGISALLVRSSLNRRRMAAWELAWRATEPRWTTHR